MDAKMSDDRRPIISVGGLDESGSENEFDSRNIGADASSILSEEDGVFGDVNGKLQAATHDWLNMTYIIIYLQGVGSLLPWNFFITARGYFEMKFKGDANIQNMFESAFSVAAMIPNVLSLLVNVFLTKQVNRNLRMLTCLFVTLVCFILTAAFVRIDTSSWTKEFFGVTIGIVALINMACAIYGGTFFGVAGVIGQKYTQAMMGGQGLGGTFAALQWIS
ncbi:equilibrative nucleoside transporter 3-like [Rhopilema esculentum]|uniref:equilibrative nucleoside transporter 3-like n=1 Tax=Rhopilema esculentum TaxID=499914 RepID=UPI0031DBB908